MINDGRSGAIPLEAENPAEETPEMMALVAKIGGEIGFSFSEEHGDPSLVNDDGVWEYEFEINGSDRVPNDYAILLNGENEAETQYRGWGSLTIPPFHAAMFANSNLVAMFSPAGGTVGGLFDLGEIEIEDLEDHLIYVLNLELEVLRNKEETNE